MNQAPILFEVDLDAVLAREVPRFKAVPKFQAVERDIAVLVDERVTHDALMAAIWAAPVDGVLRDALLFDIYRPKAPATGAAPAAEKSMAVRLTLNTRDESALTEAQIESAVAAVKNAVSTASAAIESVQKAVKQATELAEANFNAVTASAVSAAKPAKAAKAV